MTARGAAQPEDPQRLPPGADRPRLRRHGRRGQQAARPLRRRPKMMTDDGRDARHGRACGGRASPGGKVEEEGQGRRSRSGRRPALAQAAAQAALEQRRPDAEPGGCPAAAPARLRCPGLSRCPASAATTVAPSCPGRQAAAAAQPNLPPAPRRRHGAVSSASGHEPSARGRTWRPVSTLGRVSSGRM